MNSIKTVGRYIGAAVVILALLAPSVLPSFASAALMSERSITLSSASVAAAGVTYTTAFTADESAHAVVVDFCHNSPVLGQPCEPAAGFNAADAATQSDGFSIHHATATRVILSGAIAASDAVTIVLENITNPEVSGLLYARIVTYDSTISADASSPGSLGGGVADQGSVAIAITPTIGVSGTVLETITFCVSGRAIGANCTDTVAPVLRLGQSMPGGETVLIPGALHEGSIYTQLSTNALNGAVVRLKSNATDCGGMVRQGAPNACDIGPADAQGIRADAGQALFGVKTTAATSTPGVETVGSFQPVSGSIYNNINFTLGFVADNTSGVTGVYGDPFLDTAGAPANNQNMELIFGVTAAQDTPAGTYHAGISLIAAGRF